LSDYQIRIRGKITKCSGCDKILHHFAIIHILLRGVASSSRFRYFFPMPSTFEARSLQDFHPIVRDWFVRTYGNPTPPQTLGWPSIAEGNNTLILAPTGSGKTLAAFLWAINHLIEQHLREELPPGVRILYVSPLKALNNDIERNLEAPLQALREEAKRAGLRLPAIRAAVRTGDTPQSKRTAMLKHPPDILITTPESLYLMLTSKQARKMFRTVQYLIVDEIHSLCGNKRGVHLSLTLERLQEVAEQEIVRIGLSATQRPLDTIAAFLGGQEASSVSPPALRPRSVTIVDAGRKKEMDLRVDCPVADFSLLPQESVWPQVFAELLENIRQHRTTLIFVNNRRLAERVAAKLNEMALGESPAEPSTVTNLYAVPVKTSGWPDEFLVQAYHGSMSRQARERMEADLKAGKLRALVATSSLELGIDIGSIDLVVQLQSPKGVARGLQRVGRSGHLVTATSKGRVLPTYREDLVESAVVARAMRDHDVEETHIPRDCLDVLAQQIVAMVSVETWDCDHLYDFVRRSYCYRTLSRKLFDSVVMMLAGRYTSDAFRELRPRISWDKIHNTLHALPGSGHLAITSGGTIADRGYFAVYLEDGRTKVGEVDEEFVYESRTGDTFILGTNVWRMTSIDAQRITVAPAPGQPARMPFWRGEGIGRSFELGIAVGGFRREMSDRVHRSDCLAWLQREFPIDSRAAWNIQEYFRKQHQVAGIIPHDRLILVEGFRDEIGDPRIVVHASFGRRVNGLLGILLSHRLHEETGIEPQMFYNDDGILFRTSDATGLPLDIFNGINVATAQDIVLDGLLGSPLFGGQFRQNAARALLMPRLAPGKRTPLWLQRLRAGDLLQIARQFDDFPIVVETMREVLNDILDLQHFKEIIGGIANGTIGIHRVETETPSPFSAGLLFDFIAVYMYEWDQPRADRLSRYLAVNRELLSEVIDVEAMPGLLRPEAIEDVELQLQHEAEGYRARSPEEFMELLLRLGDLSREEIAARCAGNAQDLISPLEQTGRVVRLDFPDGPRWIAGEEIEVYRNLHLQRNASYVVRRYLQGHGPVTRSEILRRFGLPPDEFAALESSWSSDRSMMKGRFRPTSMPGGDEPQWCYRPNIERIHRQTITILRKEITPSSIEQFTRFLLSWTRLLPVGEESGLAGIQLVLARFHGIALPAEIWEREILGRRVPGFSPELLSSFTAGGTVVWAGAGQGRIKPLFRGEGAMFLSSPPPEESGLSEPARRILRFLRENGASFLADVREGTHLALDALNNGIAELFWGGSISNDVFSELMAVKRTSRSSDPEQIEPVRIVDPRHNPLRARLMHRARRALKQVPGWTGRWFHLRTPAVLGDPPSPEDQASAQALQLLERYGIVAREFHAREDLLPWALVASEFQRMELRGEIRRGYFVEGLSGMQYALPGAVEELRRHSTPPDSSQQPVLVNACDPANPYGPGVDIRPGDGIAPPRVVRIPGNYLAIHRGAPILLFENDGARIRTLAEADRAIVRGAVELFAGMLRLPASLRPFRELVVEYCDSARPVDSPLGELLRSLGFMRDKNQTMRKDLFT
jgi:ATP-dependent helicase Lhr and Lhr-like helicase